MRIWRAVLNCHKNNVTVQNKHLNRIDFLYEKGFIWGIYKKFVNKYMCILEH